MSIHSSNHVLNLMYSLQHISQALKSYVETYVHTRTYGFRHYLYLFFHFINVKQYHAHSILLFHHTQWVQLGLSRGPSPLHPLYLFPSLLVPVGVWTDHLSLDQWTLPCESQTLGDTGYDKGSWDPCDHPALGQEVSKLF